MGDATPRQHAEHVNRLVSDASYVPGDVSPKHAVAATDLAGEPVQLVDGTLASDAKALRAVEQLGESVHADDGETEIDSLLTLLFVALEGLFSLLWRVSPPPLRRLSVTSCSS